MGRRYSRADEIGCPFGITIDYETLRDKDVTLRDRDTTVRGGGSMADDGDFCWSILMSRTPVWLI